MRYPRTLHVPWSPGVTSDDKVHKDISFFEGKRVLITEKLDGECTSMFHDRVHARSETSASHESQSFVRQMHAMHRLGIPKNLQIVGENVYAEHSVRYDRLTDCFYVFAIFDLERQVVLSVADMDHVCAVLGFQTVPKWYLCEYPGDEWMQKMLPATKSAFGPECEGYVIRVVDEFPISEFALNTAKWVRKGHVTSPDDWRKNWKKNERVRR
jgi:hypothetical protein